MTHTPIATAADYADAMVVAKRAKTTLFIILLLMLLIQIAVFFVAAYTEVIVVRPAGPDAAQAQQADGEPLPPPATLPVTEDPAPMLTTIQQTTPGDFLQYLTGLINFLGITLMIVLSATLLVLVLIMLVGRLIGVSRMTSAWLWSVVLAVLLFPWQAFLVSPVTVPVVEHTALERVDFKVPGVFYTWSELQRHGGFMHQPGVPLGEQVLKWTRFVVFPVVALVILLMIQIKSNRGLRMALGEGEVEEPPPARI